MKTVTQTIFGALAALTSSLLLAAVNINTATVDELKSLPGVGPAKAAVIVEYRSRNGNFKSVEELKQVKGIGELRVSCGNEAARGLPCAAFPVWAGGASPPKAFGA